MKPTIQYAIKNIKFNKLKSIGAVLICFACVAFFAAEALSLWNFKIRNSRTLDNTFGIHNGIFACYPDVLSGIKNDVNFIKTGTISVLYNAVRNEVFFDRRIVVGTADKNAIELQKIQIINGEFPQNTNEIALEQTTIDLLFTGVKIGDKITLKIISPDERDAEFTLVGVFANFSALQWDPKETGMPMINALTTADYDQTAMYSFVSVLGEIDDPEKFGCVYYPNQRDNYDALKSISGISSDATTTIIIAALAFFTLAVMVIAVYALNRGHERNIGLMKVAGFSGKTILLFLAVKSILLFVPSAVIGTAIGVAVPALIDGELPGKSFAFAVICGVVALIVMLLANLAFSKRECKKTVIENLRSTERVNSDPKTKFTSDKPAVLYAVKNFLVNGKETAATCVMVYLSVVVLFVMSAVFETAKSDYFRGSLWAFDTAIGAPDQMITTMNISRYPNGGISDSEFTALNSGKDVGYALGEKRLRMYIIDEDLPFTTPEIYADIPELAEKFVEQKSVIGFPNCSINGSVLYGLDEHTLSQFQKYLVEGEFDINALRSGREVIWNRTNDAERNYSAGDKIKIGFGLNLDPNEPSLEKIQYREFEVTVAAVISLTEETNDTVGELYKYCFKSDCLIWSEKAFDEIGISKNYDSVYLLADSRKDGFDTSLALINELKMYYGNMLIVQDYLQQSLIFWQSYDTFQSITLLVSGGLALFSLVSLTVVTITKLSKRKKVFGFLRAVGLSKQQMTKTILLENGLPVTASFVYGTVCGISVLIIMGTGVEGLFYPIMLAAAYLVAIVVTSITAVQRSFKTTIIDCIRCE